ncbi:uncharacterized protein LOC125505810 [Dendroctonus ponderosae]|uniref:uncharacterized protein LOC125505810 n=1 Tax=Dendroctonus ponderosae TaxID=77166 RepID=UPI0020364C3D|nr:uncharacterized protein LOC125505810 [Dendroctonus ponderosae]
MPFLYRCIMITRFRLIRILIFVLFVAGLTMVLLQSYKFLEVFDVNFWIQYAPFYFLTVYMVLNSYLMITLYDIWTPRLKIARRCVFTDLQLLGSDFKAQITSDASTKSILFLVYLSLITSLMITHIISLNSNRRDIFIIALLMDENVSPTLAEISHWIICGISCVSYGILCLPAYYVLYGLFYLQFHFEILLKYVQEINGYLKFDRQTNRAVESHQKKVKKSLGFIIKRHQEILIFVQQVSAYCVPHSLYTIGAMLILMFAIFSVFVPMYTWVQSVIAAATFFEGAFYLCYQGQIIENMMVKLAYSLTNILRSTRH